jgi:DNA-binding NarL/FixJ family response regulator
MKEHHKAIRILIVDDHPVIQTGLTSMLATHGEVEVAAAVSSGQEALAAARREMPDIILLDLRMPGMSGVDTLRALKAANATAKVIILTHFETDEDIYLAIQAGARGYLLKNSSERQILEAIATVHAGQRYIPHQIAFRLAERMLRSNLTAREHEILQLLARGFTNKQIGGTLNISENTARNHVNSIIQKLEVSDRTEAVAIAIQQGLLRITE